MDMKDNCHDCGKEKRKDPFDPRIATLTSKQRDNLRKKLIGKLEVLKADYPDEEIIVPDRHMNAEKCYRLFRITVKHLYAKRNIATYRIYLIIFTLVTYTALTAFFGDTAGDYIKKEMKNIAKYDKIFYDLACKYYNPNQGEGSSPEYRLLLQICLPIGLVIISFVLSKFTTLASSFTSGIGDLIISQFKSNGEEFHTLLDRERIIMEDEKDEDDVPVADLEDDIPAENKLPNMMAAFMPQMANFLTSLRPPTATGSLRRATQPPKPSAKRASPVMYEE